MQNQTTQPEKPSVLAELSAESPTFTPRVGEINLRFIDKLNREWTHSSTEKFYEPTERCFQCGVEFKRSDAEDETAVYAMSCDRWSQIWMHRACAFKFGEELTVRAMVGAAMAAMDPGELRRLRVWFRDALEE